MADVCVVDARVAAKWVLPASTEPFAQQADELLRSYKQGDIELIVPDLFWCELGNILWKRARRKQISADAAELSLQHVTSHDLPTIASQTILSRAFSIATNFDRSMYDSIYVALAVDQKASLITADEKLANALAAYFPVKWLGLF